MINKLVIVGGIILIVLAAAILVLPSRENGTLPSDATPPLPPPPGETNPPQNIIEIEMTSQGFSPSQLIVTPGTTVHFVNKDSNGHWPSSGIHPTHQLCPGFDSLRPLQQNETYSFTFRETKQCPMHDHLNPSLKGKIIVQ